MSGKPWSSVTPASVNRKNKTSVISDTGANLALLDKTKFKIVTCTATGSGFTLDHTYHFSDDGTTVTDLGQLTAHDHSGTADGGSMINILRNNPEVLDLYLTRKTDLLRTNWNETVTGTGSIEDGGGGSSNPYIRLRPNATSGSGATISLTVGAGRPVFDSPIILGWVGKFETASSLAFHGGVNADDVTVADSNTVKIQAEVCTTTNNNWWIRTANGSANSASDVGVAIDTSDRSVKLIHDPWAGTPADIISINAAGEFTKTTNVATGTAVTQGRNQVYSIKNSTGADRPYRYNGSRLMWYTSTTWFYGGL